MNPEYEELIDEVTGSTKLAEDLQSEPTAKDRIAEYVKTETENMQRHNGCDDLKPYERTTTIELAEREDGPIGSEIKLYEKFTRTMDRPTASIVAIVSVIWPVEGGDEDRWIMTTNLIGSFDARAGMYDGGKSIEAATQQARRWRDSTIKALAEARYQHARALGLDLDGEVA